MLRVIWGSCVCAQLKKRTWGWEGVRRVGRGGDRCWNVWSKSDIQYYCMEFSKIITKRKQKFSVVGLTTGQCQENKIFWSFQSTKWDTYNIPLSLTSQGSLKKNKQRDSKSKRWYMIQWNSVFIYVRQLYIWTGSSCDYSHRTCTRPCQTKISASRIRLSGQPIPKLRNYW